MFLKSIPGLEIPRKKIAIPLVDSIFADVSKLKGYKIRAGKYGVQPFSKILDATQSEFEKSLFIELKILCQKLGPQIDRVLAEVLRERSK